MMSWYKQSNKNKTNETITLIKDKLRTHKFFKRLMRDYHIPESDIDNHLAIIFVSLDGKFAEGNGEEIKIDPSLLDGNFFRDNFHFVVHEFFHWIKRRAEALFYFNDDEEIQSFALAIAWEMLNGKSERDIRRLIYPIVAGHFSDESDAEQMFAKMMTSAQRLAKEYLLGD